MKKTEIILRNALKKIGNRLPDLFSHDYFADHNNRVMFGIAGLFVVATWTIAIFRFQPSAFLVPVRYDSFLGVTQLGGWLDLYTVPAILLLCIVINTFLGRATYKKDKMISYIFTATNIFLSVVALLTVINFTILIGTL